MTGFATKLSGVTFPSVLRGIRLPKRTKLVGEYLLGVSEAESIKNRADSSRPLTVQDAGSIVYNADHAIVRSHNTTGYGFLTGLYPADDCTLIVVRKNAATATEPHIVGGGTAGGLRYGMSQSAGNSMFRNGELTNLGASRALPGSATDVYFEAGVMSRMNPQLGTGGFGKLYYYSAGVQVVAGAADPISWSRDTIPQICIGSTSLSDTFNANSVAVYLVGVYAGALTAAEIEAAFQACKAYYATRGVTVI